MLQILIVFIETTTKKTDEQDDLMGSPSVVYESSGDASTNSSHSDDESEGQQQQQQQHTKLSVHIKTEPIDNLPSIEVHDTSITALSTTATATNATAVVHIKTRQSSAHIHLWQFLKELLASPQLYGTAIRWLDRQRGVFKIEDSVRVARLWGRRKNRPAMNYDKLSRSIRQYYKKGIMKKTERSQRLVYQFCTPYAM